MSVLNLNNIKVYNNVASQFGKSVDSINFVLVNLDNLDSFNVYKHSKPMQTVSNSNEQASSEYKKIKKIVDEKIKSEFHYKAKGSTHNKDLLPSSGHLDLYGINSNGTNSSLKINSLYQKYSSAFNEDKDGVYVSSKTSLSTKSKTNTTV